MNNAFKYIGTALAGVAIGAGVCVGLFIASEVTIFDLPLTSGCGANGCLELRICTAGDKYTIEYTSPWVDCCEDCDGQYDTIQEAAKVWFTPKIFR